MAVSKDPRDLETAEPFVSLFPIVPDELALLTRSMRERGYIKDKPILAWRDAFGQKDRTVVVDGHSRRLAALDAGLSEVTVTLHRFASVDEALAESIEEQATRRNITRSQLVVFVLGALADLDTGDRGQGARNDLIGRSARQLGDMLGVTSKTIERARALLMFGEPELIERVKQGDLGLKQAADLARKAGQEEKKGGRRGGGSADEAELIEPAPEADQTVDDGSEVDVEPLRDAANHLHIVTADMAWRLNATFDFDLGMGADEEPLPLSELIERARSLTEAAEAFIAAARKAD